MYFHRKQENNSIVNMEQLLKYRLDWISSHVVIAVRCCNINLFQLRSQHLHACKFLRLFQDTLAAVSKKIRVLAGYVFGNSRVRISMKKFCF